jgi:hypothetical protein
VRGVGEQRQRSEREATDQLDREKRGVGDQRNQQGPS